ncbi:MAG: acyl-CoA synthetase (AMP-forming)/AMP-acid ligase [Flavipsychrobacter sp.]|jgi:acyl-CoA synthetase (AMP-forming)/AMP-acid ligase II|nr:acyl-CoA synthetase (AMP-forming)/AMP-acid ligase [Flavipsychrobacter sp.]
MLYTLKQLHAVNITTPKGMYKLAESFFKAGINPMALLRFSSKLYPDSIAVVDEGVSITYKDLYQQSKRLAAVLREDYNVKPKQRIAVICRNHASFVKTLFSVSATGADIYLLNIEMSPAQFKSVQERYHFDLVILDEDVAELIEGSGYKGRAVYAYHLTRNSVERLSRSSQYYPEKNNFMKKAGSIVVLSSGTTGAPKAIRRRPDIRSFLNPFCALLTKASLGQHKSVYIATPMYHGYGLAGIVTSILLGSKVVLLERFDAATACSLIKEHKIDVVTLVPVMLRRMLHHDAKALHSLACIISGGAALSPVLVSETHNKLGLKLFNLYGTSEAGLSILATPEDLKTAPNTIGKVIRGVRSKIVDAGNNEVNAGNAGRIFIKNSWSVKQDARRWVETGDIGYRDDAGRFYLCGRVDDMIISGGENVHPLSVEHVLLQHEDIAEAAVVGVEDAEFGQRLKAYVVTKTKGRQHGELLQWLKPRVARYEMPAALEVIEEMPYTALGKPDKRALTSMQKI